MGRTVLYMSMSLDGFAAGPNETADHGLGDGGRRLHAWMTDDDGRADGGPVCRPTGTNGGIWDAFMDTGAVVGGRRLYEMCGGWGGDHHDGVPLFWLVRDASAYRDHERPGVRFLDDVVEAMTRAREAAGDRDVLVHGVGVARLALAAGVLDELCVSVIPVLLGGGRPLFEDLGPRQDVLERLEVLAGERGVTHLRYRVRHGDRTASTG